MYIHPDSNLLHCGGDRSPYRMSNCPPQLLRDFLGSYHLRFERKYPESDSLSGRLPRYPLLALSTLTFLQTFSLFSNTPIIFHRSFFSSRPLTTHTSCSLSSSLSSSLFSLCLSYLSSLLPSVVSFPFTYCNVPFHTIGSVHSRSPCFICDDVRRVSSPSCSTFCIDVHVSISGRLTRFGKKNSPLGT
jgi:hypothetical protein